MNFQQPKIFDFGFGFCSSKNAHKINWENYLISYLINNDFKKIINQPFAAWLAQLPSWRSWIQNEGCKIEKETKCFSIFVHGTFWL